MALVGSGSASPSLEVSVSASVKWSFLNRVELTLSVIMDLKVL